MNTVKLSDHFTQEEVDRLLKIALAAIDSYKPSPQGDGETALDSEIYEQGIKDYGDQAVTHERLCHYLNRR